MRIVQRTLAAAALTMLLITAPAVQLPAQRPIQIAPPIDLQDCESLRRELEELQRELADTNREIQQLQRRINALDARISDFRERLRNPDSNMKWWPGVDVEAINSMLLDRLEAAILARSRLINELGEYQQRLVELRKLIAELLQMLGDCKTPATSIPPPSPNDVGQVGQELNQSPLQPAPPTARRFDDQDCDALKRELEELQRELADTNREIQQLQRRINALDARISDFRERLRNPDSNMKWWPGVDVEAINSMLVDRLEAAVLARSRLIKELREYQQRLVELRKLIAELLKLLEKCQPQSRVAPEPQPPQQVGQTPPLKLTPANQRILDLHNRERVAVGAPPLQWDPALAWTATAYAAEMARTGKFGHASREGRGIVRENINQAFHGSSPDQLMANWLNEKRNFVGGTFPNVSRTGNWDDVGHYSQIIWPTTTHVGCGSARGARWDYFVCRYSPGGNKDGQPVGPAPPAN